MKNKNYTNKYNFNNEVTKDIILYGKHEEETKKYVVKFIDEGKVIETKEYEEGSLIVKPSDPEKEGYTFLGWYEGENKYDLNTPVYKDVTLESKYEINKYKVVFKNYDGSIMQETEEEYNSLPQYKEATPVKESTEEYRYEFKGWNKELTVVKDNQEYIAEYNAIKRIYTVTYIDEGVVETEEYEYGSVVTEKEVSKEGYTFLGWHEENEKVIFPLTVTRNYTLESKYEIQKFNVTFKNYDG